MSHLKERKETNCLNCNAEVNGKYCSVCGQENIEPAESAGHLISHFFNDITHFDGKFFSSLKYLILKPGFLSQEYKAGRRTSYLNPIRMYVFTSFIFFFVFFSVYHFDDLVDEGMGGGEFNKKTKEQILAMDSVQLATFAKQINPSKTMSKAEVLEMADSAFNTRRDLSDYQSKAEYDSLLRSGKVNHGWFQRKVNYRKLELDEKYHHDYRQVLNKALATFTHSFPQMLFVGLPLFALFLKLLYRRRKEFYYVSHAIFSIHLYIFTFIVLLALIGVNKLEALTNWGIFGYINGALIISIFFYEYKAMRNFYGQSRGKTIAKFILLNLYLFFIVCFIFIGFSIFSLLKV